MRLVDMHCHLDRMANGLAIAQAAAKRGIGFFCTTVTPQDAAAAEERFSMCTNVRAGVGLHPWWLADGTCDARDVADLEHRAATARFMGEVGLDGGKRGGGTLELQLAAFQRMARAAAAHPVPGRILSIHAIRTVTPVLDTLEQTGLAAEATCVVHWFSGTSDELWRAVRMGCLFSINEHMLATKRGREYVRILPAEVLLLETDAPPQLNAPYELDAIEHSLDTTLDELASIRRCDRAALACSIADRSTALLDLPRVGA